MIYGWQIMLFIAVWVCIVAGAMCAAAATAIYVAKRIIAKWQKSRSA